jgi:small subunit ribosomal protein S11
MVKSDKKNNKKVVAKKVKKVCQRAHVFIKSTYNNTLISICDLDGNVLTWSSPGAVGFKGSRESTAYAATKAAEDAYEKAKKFGVVEATVKVNGTGAGRNAAVKGLRAAGLRIRSLMDVTSIPHGGCSPKKKTRS